MYDSASITDCKSHKLKTDSMGFAKQFMSLNKLARCVCYNCTKHSQLSSLHLPLSAEEFLFGDAGSYAFMSNGYVAVPGLNDSNEFNDTVEAMNIMGMPEEEQSGESCAGLVRSARMLVVYLKSCYNLFSFPFLSLSLSLSLPIPPSLPPSLPPLSLPLPLPPAIFRVVSAVLHFGNLQFKQERNSDQALLPDNTVAQKIAKLTGMPVSDFTKALLKPKIKTGREFTVRSQNKAQVSVSLPIS